MEAAMSWIWTAMFAALLAWAPFGANVRAAGAAGTGAAGRFDGAWHGEIVIVGQVLKIAASLVSSGAADSLMGGTLDIPAQGVRGLVLSGFAIHGDSIQFRMRDIAGDPTFSGRLAQGVIDGRFTQSGVEGTFTLSRGALEHAPRPQDPKPPFPYHSSEVRIAVHDGVTLAGTVTVPDSGGHGVAAVLVTGSGPQNRDEEVFDHRPFAVMADALSRAGVTVLRCDDRGLGGSTGSFATATTRDFADDAQAGVDYLRRLPGIRSVGIVGHSEGGLVAQMLCVRDSSVAWAVTLAGPAVSGREINTEQIREMILLGGGSKEAAAAAARDAETLDAVIERGAPPAEIREGIRKAAIAQGMRDSTAIEALVNQQAMVATSAWFREFLAYDPRLNLRKIRVPFLAYYGGKDMQVPAAQNEGPARAALRSNAAASVVVWPGLNHLFQHANTGTVAEYATIQETISPEVLGALVQWVAQRGGEPGSRR
jgi:pimeloyl-ACP methyl ester carboxylesterase